MNFSEQLNSYIEELNCSSKELAEKSGISTPVISRFRNGKKIPNLKTSQLDNLSEGLFSIAREKNINLSKEVIYSSLLDTLDCTIDMEQLRKNFNELVSTLNINITSLSNSIGFSPSLISKIKSGQRNPFNLQEFANGVCKFIVSTFKNDEDKKAVASLINCKLEDLYDENIYFDKLLNWILYNSTPSNNINSFLNHLDEFDLDQYIKVIHFDEIKVPYIPFYKAPTKTYFGIQEMKQGELEFFKATVLSKSTEPVFMCSDMPMNDLASDVEFSKKWMYAIAVTLKKGLHLNVVHNLNRPFNEMMLGLESWIPLYMTGQISPYYLNNFQDNTYCHLNYVSGNFALAGECIKGYHNKGKYELVKNKKDVEYYKQKSKNLLKIAKPLMEIYRSEEKDAFLRYISSTSHLKGNRRRILPTLPIHTISEELLIKILKRNNVSSDDIKNIVHSYKVKKEFMNTVLIENTFVDEIEELSEEEFNKQPQLLFLASSFYENKVNYNYEEYLEHLKLTKEFAKKTNNYVLKINRPHAFSNIQIFIHENEFVMISKNTHPAIHFVIHHPKLTDAIEKFMPPIID